VQESVPQELKGGVFDRYVDGEPMAQAERRPKLAAGGFHRTGTNRRVAGGQIGIVEMVSVVWEVIDFALDDWISPVAS